MRRRVNNQGRGERGNSLIEFALSFLFLFPMMYGTYQFGMAFFQYNELQAAVRNGARYAGYRTYNSSNATPSADYAAAVQNMVVFGSPDGGTTPLAPGLTTSMVTVTPVYANGVPDRITVAISGYPLNVMFTTITLNKPSASFPYMGVYQPPS
jgi:Flp pilus assembly protein TadG